MKCVAVRVNWRTLQVGVIESHVGDSICDARPDGVTLEGIPLAALLDAIGKDACKEHFGLVELTEPGAETLDERRCREDTGHAVIPGYDECRCGLQKGRSS